MNVPSDTPTPNLRYPTTCRLQRSADYRTVYDTGFRFQTPWFAAFCLWIPDQTEGPKFGYTTPRALGKAVGRNRLKRRLREQIRLALLQHLDPRWKVVFNPRKSLHQATVPELLDSLAKLRKRLDRGSS